MSLTQDSPDFPTPPYKGPAGFCKPYDLEDTTPSPNDPELPNINAVVLEIKNIALHAHLEVGNQTSAYVVRGKACL